MPILTMSPELMGGVVIDQLHKVIKAYTLIVSFMPAISALSGNLGLQASANTIRGIGTGRHYTLYIDFCKLTPLTRSNYLQQLLEEHGEGD